MGDDLVLIGPNGWPIVIAGVLFSILGYWLWRSTNPRPAGSPSLMDRLSTLRGVNTSAPIMSPAPHQTTPDQQTDGADRRASAGLSADPEKRSRLAVDRTRTAVMEELLTLGWTVTELRKEGIFRGDNTAISTEIEETRRRLGLAPVEGYRTPIAGRPTAAVFETGDLAYEPPPTK